jgi:hypothetical protein
MRLRVCILAQANPFNWVTHYVEAFREVCDTIVIGPTPNAATLAGWGRAHLAHLVAPNDVVADTQDVPELIERLPEGWRPDLVVAIQSGLGAYTCAAFARARLTFNHSAVYEPNMRIFEVLAMGGALLTNREAERNGLLDLFRDGEHLVVYNSEADLLDKV